MRAKGPTANIAEREARQLIVQRGGRIWASATIKLYLSVTHCGPTRKLCFGPRARVRVQPAHAPCDLTFAICHCCDEYESVSDMRQETTIDKAKSAATSREN